MRKSATTLEPEMTQDELDFLKGHINHDSFKQLLEIGTAAGGTLCEMMSVFSDDNRPQFSVVDPMNYFPDQFEIVKRNLTQHSFNPDTVNFMLGRSDTLFKDAKHKDQRFDFILIDGSHKILHVTQDIQWASLLNEGGSLFFHDYHPNTPGVISSVDRFLKKNRNYKLLKQVDSLMAIQKIGPSTRFEVSSMDMLRAQILRPLHQLRRSIKKRIG